MSIARKLFFIITVICIIPTAALVSQSIPDSTLQKIDSIFRKWDGTATPGCAIGIVRNDSLIFSKGYGMANLEYGITITPETIFHMASISKQFTAFSIVLLARQGKLQLDDDIHKYLTWFPDLKEKITIRNLLNHTSGIRDQWQLLAVSGTRIDDVITQDHIVKLLSKQRALNFKPGEKYSYSNSGFTMLAEIVRSVTGKSIRQFTDSAIFKPLGMLHTHFHDNYMEIEKNRSYSYDRTEGGRFENSILSYSNAGATSLFTNINDMSKWAMNFYNHKVGDQKDIDQLTQKGKFNNGRENSYALGISSDTYRGWRQFSHGGADAGYRTYITVFPDLKMSFIIFSNLGDFPTNKVFDVAGLFVKDTSIVKARVANLASDSNMAVIKDTAAYKNITGDYISDEGAQFSFKIEKDKLHWKRYGQSDLLLKTANDTFVMFKDPSVKFVFESDREKNRIVNEYWPGNNRLLVRYINDTTHTDKELQKYTGTYLCPELDTKYHLVIKDHHLVLTNFKYDDAKVTFSGPDHLFVDNWWMSHLQVLRDGKKMITGFEVNDGRVMHLRFDKVE